MPVISTHEDIKNLGKILSVWAHPDDETFLAGGIMAAAAQNGQQVMCVTATKGEKGLQNSDKWPLDTLGEARSEELACALKILGVQTHRWLNYIDGECEDADKTEAIGRLKDIIQEFKPNTILTFGPDGITGHPDHCCVSAWVSSAVRGIDIKVYQSVHTPQQYEDYLKKADEKLNIFFNIDKPPLVESDECAIAFSLPPEICEKKCDAIDSMPSQTETMNKIFGRDFIKHAFSAEYFMLAR